MVDHREIICELESKPLHVGWVNEQERKSSLEVHLPKDQVIPTCIRYLEQDHVT